MGAVPDFVGATPFEPPRQAHLRLAGDGSPEERLGRLARAAGPRLVSGDERRPLRLAEDDHRARFRNRELLSGDLLPRAAEDIGVIEADVRQQDDARVDHVRRVMASAEARLDHGDVDLLLSELRECRRGEDLELRRAFRARANALDGGFEARVLAGDLDALAPAAHVRRRVRADT